MKKKIFITLSILVVFALVNISPLLKFYANISGKKLYENWDFILSLPRFAYAGNFYNVANSYYKMWQYETAINLYEAEEQEKSHAIYHNIWNSYYYMAYAEISNLSKRMSLLKKSLNAFQNAEALELHEKTKINKEIVEKEIERLENALKDAEEEQQWWEDQESSKQDQSSEQNSKEDTAQSETESSEQSQESGTSQDQNQQDQNSLEKTEEEKQQGQEDTAQIWESTENNGDSLSDEEQEAIEKYAENLERAQQQYGDFYNKVYQEWRSEFESIFWNNPFFDNSLLEEWSQKKDW